MPLRNSCFHEVGSSVSAVKKRILTAGITFDPITAVTTALSRKFQFEGYHEKGISSNETVVAVPFFPSVTNNMKYQGKRFDVKVVWKNSFKLSGLDDSWKTKHRQQFVDCLEVVIHCVPVACGNVYIEQTSRCINERLTEHRRNIKNKASPSLLVWHCLYCTDHPVCELLWNEIEVFLKKRVDDTCLILETIGIGFKPEVVISEPSLVFRSNTQLFLSLPFTRPN